MLAAALPLSLALLVQVRVEVTTGQRSAPDTIVRQERVVRTDTTVRDSMGPDASIRKIPVTAEHLATAFEDARARSLLGRARDARLRQDSTLLSYDAKTYQRASVGMGIKAFGRERLLMRHENSARVRWRRGEGAVIDVTGARSAIPIVFGSGVTAEVDGTSSIPYFPGRDDLWFGAEAVEADRDEVWLVHPIASGAEAYYRYATGDSVSFRLPDGSTVRLIELRVRPREPSWRLGVGSLWFDASTAQLVRAVYRLAVPIDFWEIIRAEGEEEEIPAAARALMQPMTGSLNSLIVEHGLHEGRFWLPRAQMAEGEAQVGFMRIPVRIEERFEYLSVNGTLDTLPEIPDILHHRSLDSLRADSLGLGGDERREWMREQSRERREVYEHACDGGAKERTNAYNRHNGIVPVLVRVPCDTFALMRSPELPPSIFDSNEELFTKQDMEQVQDMLGFNAQAGFGPRRPTFFYGPARNLLRYNRVEGLSAGLGMRQELGEGLALEARAQLGVADWAPNGELSLERSDGARTVRVGGYRRLVAANDWGTPLAFGASLNALLFGRDEGFYYRTLGAELVASGTRDARFEWRLFAERHDAAERETHFSLAHALHGLEFADNISADEGALVGMGARLTRSLGLDPRGFRLFGDLRLEGASGDFTFLRGALDLTLSRAITDGLAGALTVSGGSSTGELPVQRMFFLGGTQTVRGQTPGTNVGNAYWMARAELGTNFLAARPVVFYDVGWAGDRGDWRTPGRPMSGAGIGASFLDGLLRLDLARGIQPRERWTMNFYLDAAF